MRQGVLIDGRHIARNLRGWYLGRHEFGGEVLTAVLQLIEALLDAGSAQAFGDSVDQVAELTLDGMQRCLVTLVLAYRAGLELLPFLAERRGECRQQIGRHQLASQGIDDLLL